MEHTWRYETSLCAGERAGQMDDGGKREAPPRAEQVTAAAERAGTRQQGHESHSVFVQTQVTEFKEEVVMETRKTEEQMLVLLCRVDFLEMENEKLGDKLLYMCQQLAALERTLHSVQSSRPMEVHCS